MECECIRCRINERVTYPFTYINNIPCSTQYNGTEENKFILLKYETPCNILYIQIKIYLLSITIYPYRYSTIWVWKFARTVTTTVTSTVFIKLTSRFVILVASVSCRLLDCSKSVRRSVISWWWLACRQKGGLEDMLNLFHNIEKLVNLLRAFGHVYDGTAFQTWSPILWIC